jgi:hypothetical protein
MKKILLIVAFVVTPFVTNAQSLFDSLEDLNGVDMVVVTKDAFELLSKFNPENLEGSEPMKVFNMIKELNNLKVFSTDDASIADKMETMVNAEIKKEKLTELMRVKEDDSRIKIYVKASNNKDFVSEVLMFIKGVSKQTQGNADSVIVSLTGNIDINKMADLADTFTGNKKKNK